MEYPLRQRRARSYKENKFNVKSITVDGIENWHQGTVRTGTKAKSVATGNVRSLASGSMGAKRTSLAVGTLNKNQLGVNISSSVALTSSVGGSNHSIESTSSADSFVVLDVSRSFDDTIDFRDPYRVYQQRSVKPEPRIPQNDGPIDDTSDGSATTSTSPEKDQPSPSYGRTLSRMALNVSTKLRYFTGASKDPLAMEQSQKAKKEQLYWNSIVTSYEMTHGTANRQTAEAYFNLGHAHMQMNDIKGAMAAFKSACRIWKSVEGPTHLAVGRALDAYGLAALRFVKSKERLRQAKEALDEAFSIRFHNLGVWHVDTVETYNKIASVHLHTGNLREACRAYTEVYLVRKAIFGTDHPSVAITAHSLANVHLKLSEPEACLAYYKVALDIYSNMQLPTDHPTVERLLKDIKRLERMRHQESS